MLRQFETVKDVKDVETVVNVVTEPWKLLQSNIFKI